MKKTNTHILKKVIRKIAIIFIFSILSAEILAFPCSAFDADEAKKYIPDELYTVLEDLDSQNIADGDIISKYDIEYFGNFLLSQSGELLKNAFSTFFKLFGIILLCAMICAVKTSIGNSDGKIFDYIEILCAALCGCDILAGLFSALKTSLCDLNVLVSSMVVSVSGMYAVGGNITSAVCANAGFIAGLTGLDFVISYLCAPVLQLCLGLSIASAVCGNAGIRGVSSYVRNILVTVITFTMTILSAILAYQNTLAMGADRIASRTIKFAAGSLIPVVGGAVGDMIRVISGSIGYIRNSVGILFIIGIIVLVLPTFISIMLNKFCFGLCSVFAGILGCDQESAFFNDISGLLGYAAAILTVCALFFILILTMFIKTGTVMS